MKGRQSSRRKDCLPGRPSLARNLLASWSPEMVVACCITIDLCIVTDSEHGDAGRDTTPPGGAGGLRKEEGGAKERGLLLLRPSMRQRFGGCREGPREGGEVKGAMGQVVRPAWPGSDMLLLNESFRLSLLFSPSLSIVCFRLAPCFGAARAACRPVLAISVLALPRARRLDEPSPDVTSCDSPRSD